MTGKYQIGKLWVLWHLEVQTIQRLAKCLKESDFQCSKSEKMKRRKTSYESFWILHYCLKSCFSSRQELIPAMKL